MRSRMKIKIVAAALAAVALSAQADVVTDWNKKACDFVAEAKLGPPPAARAVALVQAAVLEAVNGAVAGKASVEAAVAAASRAVLVKLIPQQEAAVTAAYQAALASVPEAGKATGVEIGEKAAAQVLAKRADDGAASPDRYRPVASAGSYVPTVTPAVPHWAQRKPWLLERPEQFRPAPPPALNSAAWARDFNEVKTVGSRTSTTRTPEQTEIARFWEYSLPSIYAGVAHSVTAMPGRDVQRNARVLAAMFQAMDDALIAVMDAKYHYNFWRPVTAIRNADQDNNPVTERDAGWVSLIDAPLHPEYPSAHGVLAGAAGTVLKADLGQGPVPELSTTSPTAKGVVRRWNKVDDFVQEVGNARIYSGIHYRFSSDTGVAIGRQVGAVAVEKILRSAP